MCTCMQHACCMNVVNDSFLHARNMHVNVYACYVHVTCMLCACYMHVNVHVMFMESVPNPCMTLHETCMYNLITTCM